VPNFAITAAISRIRKSSTPSSRTCFARHTPSLDPSGLRKDQRAPRRPKIADGPGRTHVCATTERAQTAPVERARVRTHRILAKAKSNKTPAAALGISRIQLFTRLKRSSQWLYRSIQVVQNYAVVCVERSGGASPRALSSLLIFRFPTLRARRPGRPALCNSCLSCTEARR